MRMTPQIVRETRYFPLPKRCWIMFFARVTRQRRHLRDRQERALSRVFETPLAVTAIRASRATVRAGGPIALRHHLAKSLWQEPVPVMDASKAGTAPEREKCQ